MRLAGGAFLAVAAVGLGLLASSGIGVAAGSRHWSERDVRVTTDGRLRPGHLETIGVKGFPGKGQVQVSFFPTAICEGECGARAFRVGQTDAKGAGRFQVRMPGTFFDHRERPTYFRNGERVEVNVTWEGPGERFATGSAEPEPVIAREHGHRAAASAATQSGTTPSGPLPVPPSFQLQGSNGYTLYVTGQPPREGRSGSLEIVAATRGEAATYRTPATVTETSMQADLGALGEISVTFQRSNQAAEGHCGKRPIRFDSGSYVGRVAFHGEEGYTSAEATSAPGDVSYLLAGLCGGGYTESFVGGGHPRGALLSVRNPALGAEMSVSEKRPGAAAAIGAWVREYNSGISIERYATMWMPGSDFRFDRRLRRATVTAPPPFAGTARFDIGRKAGQRWSGDLTVDLPGRAGVALTGGALRATLTPRE